MTPAILRGREHDKLGDIATVAEGRCAIAISRGGSPKTYPHLDPNEDAAAFVTGDGGCFVAVADAHSGSEASEIAVTRLVERYAPDWTARSPAATAANWSGAFVDCLIDLHHAILREVVHGGAVESRTTLAFALARSGEDELHFASLGDSHVFRVADDDAPDLGRAAAAHGAFLGEPGESPEGLRAACSVGSCALAGTRAVLLATDGISERGIGFAEPGRAVLQAAGQAEQVKPELRALEAGRSLVELAIEVQRENRAGDNIASAVIWLGR